MYSLQLRPSTSPARSFSSEGTVPSPSVCTKVNTENTTSWLVLLFFCRRIQKKNLNQVGCLFSKANFDYIQSLADKAFRQCSIRTWQHGITPPLLAQVSHWPYFHSSAKDLHVPSEECSQYRHWNSDWQWHFFVLSEKISTMPFSTPPSHRWSIVCWIAMSLQIVSQASQDFKTFETYAVCDDCCRHFT